MIAKIFGRNLTTARSYCLRISNKLESRHFYRSFSSDKVNVESSLGSSEQHLKKLLDHSASFVDVKNYDDWATLPYAEGTVLTKQEEHDLDVKRPKIDPRSTSIILFPGQGAQFVGMAKSLERVPVARDVFDYASEILNYDLMNLCNKGPAKQLNDIRYSHVAIFTTSLANLELLREERPDAVFNCVGTAGFSLGEITALVFAGALQFEQAIQLVQIRAEAILAANEVNNGGMATIKFGPDSRVIEACRKAREHCKMNNVDNPICYISNYMFPRFKALSGNEEALQYLEENFHKFRIRSIKRVKNSAACHSILMEPAIEPIKKALEHIQISDPIIRVYSNINNKPYMSAAHVKRCLPLQLTKAVRWEQTMHHLYARKRSEYQPRTILCGPGMALKSILKEVNQRAWRQSIHIGDKKK